MLGAAKVQEVHPGTATVTGVLIAVVGAGVVLPLEVVPHPTDGRVCQQVRVEVHQERLSAPMAAELEAAGAPVPQFALFRDKVEVDLR